MHETELLILGLCVAIPMLSVIARLLDIPYPIVLVLGAIPLGYLPGVPDVELDPDLVLVIFLPPLLYVAAFMADLRALRANARPLSLTAIGLARADVLQDQRRARRTCAGAQYIPELLDDVLEGRINPGRVFDFETDLDGTPEAYAAMDERRAIKSLVRVTTL